jgi:hypothetical protein
MHDFNYLPSKNPYYKDQNGAPIKEIAKDARFLKFTHR